MARLIPAAERIKRARTLIQKARALPVPSDTGVTSFAYVANVKDLMRQVRDMVKFIPYSVNATHEMKAEVEEIIKEAQQTEKDLLHK